MREPEKKTLRHVSCPAVGSLGKPHRGRPGPGAAGKPQLAEGIMMALHICMNSVCWRFMQSYACHQKVASLWEVRCIISTPPGKSLCRQPRLFSEEQLNSFLRPSYAHTDLEEPQTAKEAKPALMWHAAGERHLPSARPPRSSSRNFGRRASCRLKGLDRK